MKSRVPHVAIPGLSPWGHLHVDQSGRARQDVVAAGVLPAAGDPTLVEGASGSLLLQWPGAAVAVNYRIPIPKLRRLAQLVGPAG